MPPRRLKRLLRRLILALPAPPQLTRLARFYAHTKAGEDLAGMHVNGEARFVATHGPACRVMFDVGACFGDWTRLALRANPTAQIHCFEPLRANYERLVAQGFPPHVTCNHLGLSNNEGGGTAFVTAQSLHPWPRLVRDREGDRDTEPVTLTTLERYSAERDIGEIDLLKVDTDGHDLAVLQGAGRLLREGRIRRIQFEYGPRSVCARVFLLDFFELFAGLPYRLYQVFPRRLQRVPAYTLGLENLRYKNFVALHESVGAL